MLVCKSQLYVDALLDLECIFDFLSSCLYHCRPVFDLCSVLQLSLLKHFTCSHYRERREVLGGKVVMKTVNFMVMNRIITGYMQLLNSPWTFGLSIRKMLAIKPADLHSFFFPLLFSQPLAWTFCTVQVSLPIWMLQEDESDHWNPTLHSSAPGWNWISAGGRCSWQLTTFLQRSPLQPDSWNF